MRGEIFIGITKMSLPDIFEKVKNGVFHIVFLDAKDKRLASGTAFATCGFLVTNHHVFVGPPESRVWIRKQGDTSTKDGVLFSYADFSKRLRSGSEQNQYDFAILDVPEILKKETTFQFNLSSADGKRIGERVAFLGFPFEHENLTCHTGIISSFFQSGPAKVIQLDASVNASNSGGPLVDQNTGDVFGIVTRKATGLTNGFEALRETLKKNITTMQAAGAKVRVSIGGVDQMGALIGSQSQMLATLDEIERQANVGIGYAFSIEHLMNDNLIHTALHK
jgi:S1-C subfamily serine protease